MLTFLSLDLFPVSKKGVNRMNPDLGGIRLGFHPTRELCELREVPALPWALVFPSAQQVDGNKWPQTSQATQESK